MDDSLDALRHNQTHTIPPGTRLAWISEPLADLPEEHLRSTDETTRAALGLSSEGPEEKSRSSRASRRRLGLAIACAVVFVGVVWIVHLVTNRQAPRAVAGAKVQIASSEPSNRSQPSVVANTSTAVPIPASNAPEVASSAAPVDQHPVRRSRGRQQPAGTAGAAPPKPPPKNPTDTEDNSKNNDFLFKPR